MFQSSLFQAMYNSQCDICNGPINKDEFVSFVDGELACPSCSKDAVEYVEWDRTMNEEEV